MNKEGFLEDLAAIIEVEPGELHNGFVLGGENWDSLVIVSTIALIDTHFDITVDGKSLRDCNSIGSLLKLIEMKKGT